MSSGVGGMGIHWGTSSPRPRGAERIPFLDDADLDAALDEAERLWGTTHPAVPGTGLPEAVRSAVAAVLDGPGLEQTGFMPTSTRWEAGRVVFAGTGAILGDLESTAPGFELRTETLARRVLTEDGVAVGALLQDRRSGEEHEVRARAVVVCADGLRTPQLLFASGIRPPALGRHLNEHAQMGTLVHLSDEFDPTGFPAEPENVASVMTPYSDARPFQLGVMTLANSAFKLSLGDAGSIGGDAASRLAVLACYGAKDVRAEDRVEFSDTETDHVGMPRMRIRYRRTEADLALAERMRETSQRVAERLGTALAPPELAAPGSSLHYQGTVRMGAADDDGTSVCSPDLEVWGVTGLFVGGNGVIPTSTATNPTLTTVALARRAARRLAARLQTDVSGVSGVSDERLAAEVAS